MPSFILCAILILTGQISPSSIVARLNGKSRSDLSQLWQELGIKPDRDLFAGYQDSLHALTAKEIPLDLNGDNKNDAVIEITNGWDYQYLFFLNADKWTFVDSIDIGMQKYAAPRLRIELGGIHKRWLVIHRLSGSGTGFLRESDNWYEVSGEGITEILTVPVIQNNCATPPICVVSSANMVEVYEDSIIYQFKSRCSSVPVEKDDPDEFELFSFERNVVFKFDSQAHSFRLDPEQSKLSPAQISGLLTDDLKNLLIHYFEEFRQLALGANSDQKAWLRRCLSKFGDFPEKLALMSILDK